MQSSSGDAAWVSPSLTAKARAEAAAGIAALAARNAATLDQLVTVTVPSDAVIQTSRPELVERFVGQPQDNQLNLSLERIEDEAAADEEGDYWDEMALEAIADAALADWERELLADWERELLAGDPINHPAHYARGWSNGAEVIDITENLNFNRGNAVKYLARADTKNPDTELEDLRKAEWYVQREIARVTR